MRFGGGLGLRGGSGMMGFRVTRRLVSYSIPSGGVVFLKNLTLEASSALIDVCLSFVIVFCVKSL